MNIKRGEIFIAALDPVIGHEVAKTRPVIIVSNNIGNKYSGTVTVIPVTSKNLTKIYPFEVYLPRDAGRLKKDSKGKTDQIRTLDKARLIKSIGMLSDELMNNMDKAIKVHLNLLK
ncbi:MAG: type II toxin-antitoxin system PemK/MazF family toxin [Deltaproteobacteria bacterium]|nr:MAG: type II toxin-antitoxin system PemK/MazF family toxin [Deltaproteobacteria bacterium]